MLNHAMPYFKPFGPAIGVIMGMALLHCVAGFTDEKLGRVSLMSMVTSDIGVQGLNAVNKT